MPVRSVADPDPWNLIISLDPDPCQKLAGSGIRICIK